MELRPPRTLAIVSAAAAWALIVCNAAAQERCRLTAVGTANVVAVRDGRTLMLDDGRELQLAAIEVADDSRNALQSLVGGGPAPTRTAGRRE